MASNLKVKPTGTERAKEYVGIGNFVRTAKTHNTKNSKQIFPEKELRGYSPNSYIHVSVSDLYIPLIGLPILLQDNIVGGPNVGIYR